MAPIVPSEQGSFPLTPAREKAAELLQAGEYNWIADYSKQIVHSAADAQTEAAIEIVLLGSLREETRHKSEWDLTSMPVINLDGVFAQYDPPEVMDAVRFGAQYPDEQRKRTIIFPHTPWRGPQGPSFALVLRTDATDARGLSYVPYSGSEFLLETWWSWPLLAVRRRSR